ncbi:MAG: hypothetical protein QXM92_01870 [Candidatus Anstonellales archaeon]
MDSIFFIPLPTCPISLVCMLYPLCSGFSIEETNLESYDGLRYTELDISRNKKQPNYK